MRLAFLALVFVSLLAGCSGLEDVTVKEVQGVAIKELNQQRIDLAVDVLIENPNALSFKVKDVDLLIAVNGTSLGTTKLSEGFSIAGNSSEVHTVALSAETGETLKELGPSLLLSAFSQQVEVRVQGQIKGGVFLVSKQIEVDHTEKVNLNDLKLNGLF